MAIIKNRTTILLCASITLTACTASHQPVGIIAEQGLTVSQLYQQSQQPPLEQMNNQQILLELPTDEFKPLPNPEVPIHIFAHVAHLGDEQIIKPAYTTRFFLFKKNQYALASEFY